MNASDLHSHIEAALGEPVRHVDAAGGGSIATTARVECRSGRTVFLKRYPGNPAILHAEATGLRELARPAAIRIPAVLHVDDDILLIEHIAGGARPADFFETFGRRFAELHRTTADRFGFDSDNFIGATPQPNRAEGDAAVEWPRFYIEYRLEPQFRLAERNGLLSGRLRTARGPLLNRVPELLSGSEEPPALLHGDLWSGNFLADEQGAPCLIDPAVYYGHREADLAMTRLFGGFDSRFYSAYQEHFPLPDDYAERIDLYMLYHVLNHLNLFGTGYLGQAERLAQRYV